MKVTLPVIFGHKITITFRSPIEVELLRLPKRRQIPIVRAAPKSRRRSNPDPNVMTCWSQSNNGKVQKLPTR